MAFGTQREKNNSHRIRAIGAVAPFFRRMAELPIREPGWLRTNAPLSDEARALKALELPAQIDKVLAIGGLDNLGGSIYPGA